MPAVTFRLAGAADGPGLRRLLAEVGAAGGAAETALSVRDFWGEVGWAGRGVWVVVGECAGGDDGDRGGEGGGELVGLGTVVVYPLWLAGRVRRMAYLTQLRVRPEHRRGTVLARGYRFLAEVREQVGADHFFTSVLDGNAAARGALLGGRAGLPEYRPLFGYRTYILPVGRRGAVVPCGPPDVRGDLNLAGWAGVPGTSSYALPDGSASLGLTTDPHHKATLVRSYRPALGRLRHLHNATRGLHRGLRLPAPGRTLPLHRVTEFRCGDPAALLRLVGGLGGVVSAPHVALGLPTAHPFGDAVRRAAVMTLHSTVYEVRWPGSAPLEVAEPALSVALL